GADQRQVLACQLPGQLPGPGVDRVAPAVEPDRRAAEPIELAPPHRLVEGPAVEPDRSHSARTTSASAATDGRRSSSPSQSTSCGGKSTPSMSRARRTHGTYATSE